MLLVSQPRPVDGSETGMRPLSKPPRAGVQGLSKDESVTECALGKKTKSMSA